MKIANRVTLFTVSLGGLTAIGLIIGSCTTPPEAKPSVTPVSVEAKRCTERVITWETSSTVNADNLYVVANQGKQVERCTVWEP